jgi:hypothetical protein
VTALSGPNVRAFVFRADAQLFLEDLLANIGARAGA